VIYIYIYIYLIPDVDSKILYFLLGLSDVELITAQLSFVLLTAGMQTINVFTVFVARA